MRILFIFWNVGSGYCSHGGLMQLSAIAKKLGHETALWHITNEKHRDFILPKDFTPDIVAATATDFEYKHIEEVAREARKMWPNAFYLLGGKSAIEAASKDFSASAFDAFSIGEGEKPFEELLRRYDSSELITNNNPLSNIKGFWFKWSDGKTIVKNSLGEIVTNLDELPMKDYDLFDTKKYLRERKNWMSIDFTRGCSFGCSYCFVQADKKVMFASEGGYGMANYLRKRSVDSLIGEMKYLCERFPEIEVFNFDDELPLLYPDWIMEFCKRYKDEIYAKYGVEYCLNGRIDIVTAAMAKALVESGCREIRMGFESGSFRIRKDILYKPIKEEKMRETYKLCDTYGLRSSSFTMIGNPTESHFDIAETIRLTAEFKPWLIRLTFCYPFENTPMWDIVKKMGILKEDDYMKGSGYFDDSPLKWPHEGTTVTGPELYKYRQLFPWYVNVHGNMNLPEDFVWRYRTVLDQALEMTDERFRLPETQQWIKDMDQLLSDQLAEKNIPHFCYFKGNMSYYNCRCKPMEPKAIIQKPVVAARAEQVDATGYTKPWEGDPKGYFLIRLDRQHDLIELAHCKNEEPGKVTHHIKGQEPRDIYEKIVDLNLVERPEHFAYLGKELSRAYVCLMLDLSYVQDDPWLDIIREIGKNQVAIANVSDIRSSKEDVDAG